MLIEIHDEPADPAIQCGSGDHPSSYAVLVGHGILNTLIGRALRRDGTQRRTCLRPGHIGRIVDLLSRSQGFG